LETQDASSIGTDNQCFTPDSKTRNGSPSITGLNDKYQFSNFVVGECNRFAWTAAREVCLRFQTAYNPLYLHSQTGLGKTHLGQAMGHLYAQKNLYFKIRWCTAESFSSEMIYHLKNKTLSAFKHKYRQDCNILFLDDVHFLRGKKWIQTELCYTLDVLLNEGKQIVLMGRVIPNDLDGFQEELTSRMFSGLTAKIHPPEKETRIAILKLHAANMGVPVPDTVLVTIADTIHNHIRNLTGAFTRILAMSSLLNRPIDQELAEEVLRDFQERRSDNFTLDVICHHVARYFHLEPNLLGARSRKQKIYYCRQIAMYLSRKYTHDSLQSIGRLYNRDHASVFHAIQTLENKMKSSSRIRREVDFIEEKLLQKGC
jgi:chromosomal replication initiator protein